MTRYKLFEQLQELTKMSKMDDHYGYQKMIQTGQLSLYDYNRGFIDLNIYHCKQKEGHYVRLWFGTVDDGDFGCWKHTKSEEKAREIVDKVAQEVFKDMIAFPSDDELNHILNKYGLYAAYE